MTEQEFEDVRNFFTDQMKITYRFFIQKEIYDCVDQVIEEIESLSYKDYNGA